MHETAYDLLYRVMDSVYGYDRKDLMLCKTEEGKPFFAHCPWQFSITHTEGLALVAVSHLPVGIDAERTDRRISEKVARRFLGKDSCTVEDWTQYEAVGKMLGCGIPLTTSVLSNTQYHVRFYTVLSEYTACCVSQSEVLAQDIVFV